MFLDNMRGEFSFWFGDPVLYIDPRFRSMMLPPATGILVGEGVLGDELNFDALRSIDTGELARVAAAIKLFKSESELRLFFFRVLTISCFSSGGGEAPMVLSLDGDPLLEGRSSNAPNMVGLSRETGRLPGDSIDFERITDPLDRLDVVRTSPVAVFRLVLLKVLHTEGRSLSLVLFCRSRVSANLLRKEDAFDATEPLAE